MCHLRISRGTYTYNYDVCHQKTTKYHSCHSFDTECHLAIFILPHVFYHREKVLYTMVRKRRYQTSTVHIHTSSARLAIHQYIIPDMKTSQDISARHTRHQNVTKEIISDVNMSYKSYNTSARHAIHPHVTPEINTSHQTSKRHTRNHIRCKHVIQVI